MKKRSWKYNDVSGLKSRLSRALKAGVTSVSGVNSTPAAPYVLLTYVHTDGY